MLFLRFDNVQNADLPGVIFKYIRNIVALSRSYFYLLDTSSAFKKAYLEPHNQPLKKESSPSNGLLRIYAV